MSEAFIQFTLPCETCIVQSMCKDKSRMDDVKIHRSVKTCLALPDWDINEKIYIKGLIECWLNLGCDISQKLMRIKLDNKLKYLNDQNTSIPNQYLDFLFVIANALQWMINSTSWREGKLYKFDSFEIKEKLKYLTNWLDNAE